MKSRVDGVVRSRAPLRLGFAGGGTDVSPYSELHGGSVLNATVSMYAYATIEKCTEGKVIFHAVDLEQKVELDNDGLLPIDGPLALHRGVYNRIVREFNNGEPLHISVTTHVDVPAGSGMGSSSTLVVALVEAYREYLSLPLGEYDVAHMAYEIERIDLGLNGGKQDQYAAAFGGFNYMEFGANDRVIVNPLRIRRSIIAELEASLVLFYTGVSRESANIIDDQSKLLSKGSEQSIEAMHAIKKSSLEMKELLLKGDILGLAKVLGDSWVEKKKVSSKISNGGIDRVYDMAVNAGAYAGKVSGAGGGGFMMFLVDPAKRPNVVKSLNSCEGRVIVGHFTEHGSNAWRTS